jgi:hypothetical protein
MVWMQVRSGGGSRQQAEEEISELEAELQAREQHLLDKKLRNNTFIRKVGPTDRYTSNLTMELVHYGGMTFPVLNIKYLVANATFHR